MNIKQLNHRIHRILDFCISVITNELDNWFIIFVSYGDKIYKTYSNNDYNIKGYSNFKKMGDYYDYEEMLINYR